MGVKLVSNFVRLLGTEATPWLEQHLEVASEALLAFADADWCYLQKRALSLPASVQERCAEAVGEIGTEKATGVLAAMLDSSHLDVAAVAASQLDDMGVVLPASLRCRLQELLELLTAQNSTRASDVRRLIATLNE